MDPDIISKLVALTGKKNERVILVDSRTGEACVVMSLGAYERLSQEEPGAALDEESVKKGLGSPKKSIPRAVDKKAERTDLEVKSAAEIGAVRDLTQEELLDKINRDIGAWKLAQEKKRTDELQSVVSMDMPMISRGIMEEEERFYLEPIE
jgi:hypothetical protein